MRGLACPSWLLAWLLLLCATLGASGQETYWCDSCDEVRDQHSPTCPERPRRPRAPRQKVQTPAQRLLRWAASSSDPSEAIGLYQEALALDPSPAGAWRALGTHLWRAKRWAEAERAYEEAFARRPSPSLAASLARLREARRAAAIARQRATLWRLAEVEYGAGDDLATLAALAQLSEPDARTRHFEARALARLGQRSQAALAYREALSLEADPARRELLRAELGALSAELERSRRRLRRAHLEELAASRAARGEVEAALSLLRGALPEEPRPRWIYEDLGRLALERRPLQDAVGAEWALRRALRLDPRASTWTNLGVLYDRLGHEGRALRCYERALTLDPQLPAISARVEVLDRVRPSRGTELPELTWIPAPTLLRDRPLPGLDLSPLRQRVTASELGGERALVLRFDPGGGVVARREKVGLEDPTLAWLRDHGSRETWPELVAPLTSARPLDLEGPRGWRFD